MQIISPKNKQIKKLLKLQQKSKWRRESGEFLVEGLQENRLALENGYQNVNFFVEKEIFNNNFDLSKFNVIEISKEVFDKLAYRNSTGGILGVYKSKVFNLNEIKTVKPVIVVLEEVEKPGNLGAILRTCDAVNVDAVVICNERVDFFNPNVIRSSVGTVFTNQIIYSSKEEITNWANNKEIPIYATYLREDTKSLYQLNLANGAIWVFGTEANGLSNFWINKANKTVKIPMFGQVDSLNVSNAVAVTLYETLRQINF